MIRTFINSQIRLSYNFDKIFPIKYILDGNQDYVNSLVPSYLKEDLIIYDVGGGKGPYLSGDKKNVLNATVVGLDIDKEELQQAPEGAYNKMICADISNFQGNQDADIVLCQAVLEHVKDVAGAFASISSILKNGGLALIFVPSRNALFARLNIILPQKIKKKILHYIYPNTAVNQGFPSYYNKCTPLEFKQLARDNNFSVIEERCYFKSGYFTFFFPVYLVWRLWIILFHFILKEQAAETFSLVLKKRR
jgi:SAM-dependent methyltransferase